MSIRGPYEVIHYYTGLSTDTKPTINVVLGDRYFETDTGLWYIYDSSSWSLLGSKFDFALYGKCSSSMTASTTSLVIPNLVGYGNDFFNNKFYIQVLKNANSVGNAPELQVRKITDYVSTSGTFTTDAFGANVEASDEVAIVHESIVLLGRDDDDNVFSSSNVVSNADGSVLERLEYIQVVLGGGAASMLVTFSDSETVEENAIQFFNIGIFDRDAGAIVSASIDITGISAVMEKSTGGGAFSSVGITQPTFAKTDGSVYCAYQFLAAEWQTGDMYKLVVGGVKATVHTTVSYVPSGVWSNVVVETEDIKNNVQYLYAVADTGTTSPTKVIDNSILSILMTKASGGDTSDFDNSTDSLEAIADNLALIPAATGVGVLQITTTTKDLQQSASTYDLFTGTGQAVVLEKLVFALPNVNVSDDATITYITVQTDHATAQVIFNSTTGAKANLTAEAQLSWTGAIYVPVGKKIQLTIAGGAADAATVCNITAQYRAVVAGGTLA